MGSKYVKNLGLVSLMIMGLLAGVVSGQYLYLIENDLEGPAWVDSASNVVFNQSRGVWLFNETGGAPPSYENFTSYNTASGGSLSQTDLKSSWTDWDRTAEGTLYNESHSEIGTDFKAFFEFKMSDIEANSGGTILLYPFVVSQQSGSLFPDFRDMRYSNKEAYGVQVRSDLGQGSDYKFYLVECNNGDQYVNGASVDLDVGSEYYLNFTKSGASIELKIFSDSTFSTLVDSLSLDLQANYGFNDLNVPLGQDAANGPRTSSGYVEKLTFDEPGGGYETEGFIITEDLLVNTTMGPVYDYCSSQSVPETSGLTVEFSQNKTTWVRITELSTTEDKLSEAIFIDDLNFSSVYVRYNFTGDGSETPEINKMSLSYRIDDPGEGSNGWIYLLASPVFMIIGLASRVKRF